MAMTTRFTESVGCRVPVQQAPMGPVSTSALAVAVAEAGGVGSITAMGLTAVKLDKILSGMAAQSTGVLAANFLTTRSILRQWQQRRHESGSLTSSGPTRTPR